VKTRRHCLAWLAMNPLLPKAWAKSPAYPSRAIRLIVPFPPGGPTDIVARLLGQKLAEALGQPVVIDNRAGAGGTIGAAEAAKAAADGHTLLYGSTSTLAISPTVYKNLGYEPARAFAPVALVSRGQQILVVNGRLPVSTLPELVTLSRRPGELLNYSSPGNGTPGHLATEMLKSVTGLVAQHVPYKGGAPALQAVMAGEAQFTIDAVNTSLPHVLSGRLRPLAAVGSERHAALPDLPTVNQVGYAEVNGDFWSGLVAPAGTPSPVLARLNDEVRRIVASSAFKERLSEMGAEPQTNTNAEFAAFIASEMRKWAAVARAANVRLD